MVSRNIDFEKQIQSKVAQVQKDLQNIATSTVWAVLSRNKSVYTRKLRALIDSEYYNRYAESEYYDRTYQFRKLAHCEPIKEGNGFGIRIWFDTQNVTVYAPEKKGNFYSYAYSWDTKSGADQGDFIGEEMVEYIYEGMLNRTDIEEKFMEWFEDDFQNKFDKLFSQRVGQYNKD